jgi:ribosomal-protein-alanine N-acetyltransferase
MSADKVRLRRAIADDLPRLLAIEAQWTTTPHWTAEHFKREVGSERSLGLVAEEQGRVVGFGFLWLLPGEGQVADIAVDPASARRGVGRTLLRRMIDEARHSRCETVTLEVSAENVPAQRLYAGEGFKVVGRRSKIYNGTDDALLMTLAL